MRGLLSSLPAIDPPDHTRLRTLVTKAFEDVQIGGKEIRAGTEVDLLLGAANRDPEHFPDHDRFDVGRPENRPVAFGYGIHFCLGAALARACRARIEPPCEDAPKTRRGS